MWLYLAILVGLYYLLRWYRERQVVSHLRDKYVFITGCDSGFGNLLARQLDLRGLRVLAACLTEKGAEQLRSKTSDRLETVILDVTSTESIAAATQWVKERTGDRGITQVSQVCFFCPVKRRPLGTWGRFLTCFLGLEILLAFFTSPSIPAEPLLGPLPLELCSLGRVHADENWSLQNSCVWF